MKLLPWILALMWLAARVAVGRFMGIEEARSFGILSNVLLVLIIIFITVYNKYKIPPAERPAFLQDVKDCMKQAMKYVIAVTIAIGLYYGVMSDDMEIIRETRISVFEKEISTDEGLANFQKEVPQARDQTREQLLETNKKNVETFVSVKSQVMGGFVTLTFVSFVYTLLAVFIWRTVMKRN